MRVINCLIADPPRPRSPCFFLSVSSIPSSRLAFTQRRCVLLLIPSFHIVLHRGRVAITSVLVNVFFGGGTRHHTDASLRSQTTLKHSKSRKLVESLLLSLLSSNKLQPSFCPSASRAVLWLFAHLQYSCTNGPVSSFRLPRKP